MSFSTLLYRYFFFGWLFKDVNHGNLLERAAAWRHNRAQARWLPTYLRRWLWCAAFFYGLSSFVVKGKYGQLAAVQTTWISVTLAGLMTLGSILIPAGRRSLRGHLAEWLELPQEATVAAATVALVMGVLLVLLAAGLRRRKRL